MRERTGQVNSLGVKFRRADSRLPDRRDPTTAEWRVNVGLRGPCAPCAWPGP